MSLAKVWVAYATAEQQFYLEVPFVAGMTAQDALQQSCLAEQTTLPEPLQMGIFGEKISDLQHELQAGDRLEIYRDLTINPKDIRRKRAAQNPVGRFGKGNRFKQ